MRMPRRKDIGIIREDIHNVGREGPDRERPQGPDREGPLEPEGQVFVVSKSPMVTVDPASQQVRLLSFYRLDLIGGWISVASEPTTLTIK